MEKSQRQRRPRNRPCRTSGVLFRTDHDARGIAEPLERYGELIACQLVGLYNAIHGLPPTSAHSLARLKQLFHEAEGLRPEAKVLVRPEYQWRFGYNHHTIYRRAIGTSRLLHAKGIYTAPMIRWAKSTRVMQITEDARQAPSDHDIACSFVMSSLEISIRRSPGHQFISHLDVVKNASAGARMATCPLSIPISRLEYTLRNGQQTALADVHIKPDALFGVSYPPELDRDYKFYALEYDRSTEDVEPTKNLLRASWLRKILSYCAVLSGPETIHERYLRIPNLFVLCVFSDPNRMENVMRLVAAHASNPYQFLFKVIPPVDPLLTASPVPQLTDGHWLRIGGTFNLVTQPERR